MSEKHPEQFMPRIKKPIERIEGIECPEDKENFEGQKVLVIGGPNAHGVSMAVSSAQYLEKRGAEAVIYVWARPSFVKARTHNAPWSVLYQNNSRIRC